MEALFVLVALALLLVPVLLVVALIQLGGLRSRVSRLEGELARLRQGAAAPAREPARPDTVAAPTVAAQAAQPAAPVPPPLPPREPDPVSAASATASRSDAPRPAEPARAQATGAPASSAPQAPAAPLPPRPQAPRTPPAPPRPDPLTVAARWVRGWFTEGNVPVKVGMLVLLAGVAALLKYASDQGWMRVPMELRLAGVALAAMAGLVFGWRQRERKRVFALSLQGGAIGVLLLVVFAAFKLYAMMPAGAAFALSVVLVAGAGVLAVKQDALALAVLATLAGFLAPIWLSTGSGNHVALFGYYAVLNAGIFAIAWWRPWRVLNLLGFVFTWGIGTLWGVLKYRSEHFASTEPFLLLFFAFYLLIPVLYARRRAGARHARIDGCLVFGTPLVAFSLQAGLLEGARMPLALCALGLGALYAVLAAALRRDPRFAALVAPFALLAAGFATLAVPLALAAEATACVFALEGAALAWLGLRQRRRLPQLTGAGLQIAAALAFAIGVSDEIWTAQTAVLNATFAGALLIALAGLASAWSYRRAGVATPALPYYLWGLAWWLGAVLDQIGGFLEPVRRADAVLLLAAVTGWVAAEVFRRHPWRALSATTVAAVLAGLPLALAQTDQHGWPLSGLGWLAWAVHAALAWRSLLCLRERGGPALVLAHIGAWWAWIFALGLSVSRWLAVPGEAPAVGQGWRDAALALPLLAVAAATLWRPALVAGPLRAQFERWRAVAMATFAAVLALGLAFGLTRSGLAWPLPWVPVLNPMSLLQWATVLVLAGWLGSALVPPGLRAQRAPLLAATGFLVVTVEVLRSAHWMGGVPWSPSMFSTSLVQTALTLTWSVLGVAGWIAGSRRGQRGLWLAGAVLMAVVLAKLVLVDRGHLGNLLGIASFIAYGLLCTLVGYFAPAPPSRPAPAAPDASAAPSAGGPADGDRVATNDPSAPASKETAA